MNEKVKAALQAYKAAQAECTERAETLRLARLVVSAAQDAHHAAYERMMVAQEDLLRATREELHDWELRTEPETVGVN